MFGPRIDKKPSPSEWLLGQNKYHGKKTLQKATTISITAGKGGVGKTSVAVKWAKTLASQGFKVLLIDCDYNLSNTVVKLGLPVTNDFYDLITAKKEFTDCVFKMGSFHLLAGCNGNIEIFKRGLELDRIIIDILVTHEREYDYIILDCPAGISKETLTLNAYSDYRFVVVTPDKSSVTDSYSLIKILNKEFGVNDYHLLVNKVSNDPQYQRMVKTLTECVSHFLNCSLHVLGGVNLEEGPVDGFDKILLQEENSSLHQKFVKLAKKFTEEIEDASVMSEDFANVHNGNFRNELRSTQA